MIALTPEASVHIDALERYYIEKQRPQALRNLGQALAEASFLITNAPNSGAPAPRPYPALAEHGLSWLKCGRYWIAYDPITPIIAAVFFDTDDIPTRLPSAPPSPA